MLAQDTPVFARVSLIVAVRLVTLLALLISLLPATASASPPAITYWNLSFDAQPRTCRPVQRPERELQRYFETRRKMSCTKSDEGDHLLYSCGEVKEVVAFSRESCWMWMKRRLSGANERKQVAFSGCIEQARARLGTDRGVLYCSCVAPKIAAYTEEELRSLPREKFEGFGQECAGSLQSERSDGFARPEQVGDRSVPAIGALPDAVFEGAFQTICNTGMVSAQRVLPAHPEAEQLLERGYATCVGAIRRWKSEPGGLRGIENPVEFVCGYAIGAMFTKYGLRHEVVERLSSRAQRAAAVCVSELEAQQITSSSLSRRE